MASFVLSFFPLDVLDQIWDLIESVSEGFLTYSMIKTWLYTSNCLLHLVQKIRLDGIGLTKCLYQYLFHLVQQLHSLMF